MLTIPIYITLFRLVASPIVMPFFLIYTKPHVSIFIFLLLSFTDYLDGFFARKNGQMSFFGSLIDPLADKFLLYATLTTLLYMHQIPLSVVIILLGREFLILGIRHIAAEYRDHIFVSIGGKLKTWLCMIYISLCILNLPFLTSATLVFMVLTVSASLVSALQYSTVFCKIMMKHTFSYIDLDKMK